MNAGDLILVRLEEKSERRQFEIAAHGLWRGSSGISLTHQIQILRSEVKSGVYKIVPATPITKGEYALYLSRGEGMAPYVYDFGVQESLSVGMVEGTSPQPTNVSEVHNAADASTKPDNPPASAQTFKEAPSITESSVTPSWRTFGFSLRCPQVPA